MQIFKEYSLALVSLVVTLILTLIAEFVLTLSPEGTFLTFAVGAMITLSITLLQKELEKFITNDLGKSLELYQLIRKINDPDLQSEVFNLANSLSMGEIPPNITSVRSRKLVGIVKNRLQEANYPLPPEGIKRWNQNRTETWYQANVEAIGRGVVVERIFILKREDVIKDDKWDEDVLKILQRQSNDGVVVRILWVEDITDLYYRRPERNLLTSFVLFDEQEVLVLGEGGNRIHRSPSKRVLEYQMIFEEQLKYARGVNEILEDNA